MIKIERTIGNKKSCCIASNKKEAYELILKDNRKIYSDCMRKIGLVVDDLTEDKNGLYIYTIRPAINLFSTKTIFYKTIEF